MRYFVTRYFLPLAAFFLLCDVSETRANDESRLVWPKADWSFEYPEDSIEEDDAKNEENSTEDSDNHLLQPSCDRELASCSLNRPDWAAYDFARILLRAAVHASANH